MSGSYRGRCPLPCAGDYWGRRRRRQEPCPHYGTLQLQHLGNTIYIYSPPISLTLASVHTLNITLHPIERHLPALPAPPRKVHHGRPNRARPNFATPSCANRRRRSHRASQTRQYDPRTSTLTRRSHHDARKNRRGCRLSQHHRNLLQNQRVLQNLQPL